MSVPHRPLAVVTAVLLFAGATRLLPPAAACCRVLYKSGDGKLVLVGRNMDWAEDPRSNLWVLPRAVKRDGMAAKNAVAWTAKYGSVIVSGYDLGATDGLNEAGLAANMLWQDGCEYGPRDDRRPGLAVTVWLQFCLDNFRTVDEAVKYFTAHDVQILPATVVIGDALRIPLAVHLSLADATGDTVVMECVASRIRLTRGADARVLTNEPALDKQLAGLKAYKGFGGTGDLPGGSSGADRFVRAAYHLDRLPDTTAKRSAVAGVVRVLETVAQPFARPTVGNPPPTPTVWRTVADLPDRVYHFESAAERNSLRVTLDKLDFGKVQKLDLVGNPDRVGDVTAQFRPAEPFRPLPPDAPK